MTVSPTVESVRRFNCFYTRQIGVLQQHLLGSPYSLTEVRVLYELAQQPGATAVELQSRLGLDAGYLSRMLSRFARQRMIRREQSSTDARRVKLQLTSRGVQVFAKLNEESSRQIHAMIGHLPPVAQEQLTKLLGSVEHLMRMPDRTPSPVVLRSPQPGELGWVVQQHGRLYSQEFGWDQTFEALVARIVADFGQKHDPSRERCWIAEQNGVPVGCIFLIRETDRIAKLRLLLVEPGARGTGVGQKLVDACVDFAHTAGYRKITLWTNSVLHAARRIYERAGFQLVKSERHDSFGHKLIGEFWELDLGSRHRSHTN